MAYKELINIPIPLEIPKVDGWKEVPIEENGEQLIPLGFSTDYEDIFTDSIYFGERYNSPYYGGKLSSALKTMFVRESVAEQLRKAQSLLPSGLRLIVFDAYRPIDVQQSLYDHYYRELEVKYPGWTPEYLAEETQKYVSLPSDNPLRPSPHNTGGAIDVAIIQLPQTQALRLNEVIKKLTRGKKTDWKNVYSLEMEAFYLLNQYGQLLDFGTPFDWGGVEASLNHLEKLLQNRRLSFKERYAMLNRRILYRVMTESGFEAYEHEWWHYNSKKTQMGAKSAGLEKAQFGAAVYSSRHIKFETSRRKFWESWVKGVENRVEELDSIEVFLAQTAVNLTGIDIRDTLLPKAAEIKP